MVATNASCRSQRRPQPSFFCLRRRGRCSMSVLSGPLIQRRLSVLTYHPRAIEYMLYKPTDIPTFHKRKSAFIKQLHLSAHSPPKLYRSKTQKNPNRSETMHFTGITSLSVALLMGTATALQVKWYTISPPRPFQHFPRPHPRLRGYERT